MNNCYNIEVSNMRTAYQPQRKSCIIGIENVTLCFIHPRVKVKHVEQCYIYYSFEKLN